MPQPVSPTVSATRHLSSYDSVESIEDLSATPRCIDAAVMKVGKVCSPPSRQVGEKLLVVNDINASATWEQSPPNDSASGSAHRYTLSI